MRGRTQEPDGRYRVENRHLDASIASTGYVSGVASLLDKKTGARDLGFGLDIVDFLLEPLDAPTPVPEGQYHYGPADPFHGNIPKRYAEGPQICTQARTLPVEIARGPSFTVVKQRYRWTRSYPPHDRAGSFWEQTFIFPDDERFFLASDRVTTVLDSPALVLRIDLPGHLKHPTGEEFEHVHLSYHEPAFLTANEFAMDFPPDARFLYRRPEDPSRLPERFIRAYQVNLPSGEPGPWLAGMTLNPADVHEAWCHQRGYVCMIEEIGGRATNAGDTFGAAYIIGWFDDIESMERAYDRFRGASGLTVDGPAERPTGFHLVGRE